MKQTGLCSKCSILITVQAWSSRNTLGELVNSWWSLDLVEGGDIDTLDIVFKLSDLLF